MRSIVFDMRSSFRSALSVTVATIALLPQLAHAQAAPDPLHVWVGTKSATDLTTWVGKHLTAAQVDVDKLVAVKGVRTVANTLQPYDDAQNELSLAGNGAYLYFAMAASPVMRTAGQDQVNKISSVNSELSLDPRIYKALAAVPLPKSDAATKRYLEHTLLEYKIAGIDKDDATRKQVRALMDHVTELSLTFNKNIADDVRKVSATKAELEGMPADYIQRHKPDADGAYTLTTDAPDYRPVMSFAKDAGLRKRMYLAYAQRSPKNSDVLMDLLRTRQQLATLLGYKTYAELATADQMMVNPANVQALLDELETATKEPRAREYKMVLDFAKSKQPGLTELTAADSGYWGEQFRRAEYNFDAQSVRPYFPYAEVEAGVLGTAAKLFHVSFRKVDAPVWNPAVTTYDVVDSGKTVGRIYLDMHPREGKDKWFSSAPVVPGIRGRQMPEGMLICNFSGGVAGDPGLMLHSEVITFFHEFGHLMHHILGSQNRWSQQGGFNVEGDFVEAPSQMLEEVMHDHGVLASFAKHYQTGEAIPSETVARMNRAGAFGRSRSISAQVFYATYSLELHNMPPDQVNLESLWKQEQERFESETFVEGDHGYDTFNHLTGYASNYYTYVLDKVIAIDFFHQFNEADLLNGPAAMRYRRSVLEPGATKPAADLVKDFLGRPQNTQALKNWMNEEFVTKP